MSYTHTYKAETVQRADLDLRTAPLLLEFGANWCGHCQAAQSVIRTALEQVGPLEHIKIEDGRGRPLGRGLGVKLWPTLVFWRDGQEQARVVRPNSTTVLVQALQDLLRPTGS